MRNNTHRNEEGSALIIALVMLTVVGLLVGAGMTYAGTSLRASYNSIRPNRASLYAADSAIQTAIQHIKQNELLGTPGATSCPTTVTYENVAVRVCPQPESFIPRGRTQAVLLTLAPLGGPPGLSKQGGSSGELVIRGDAWINSSIANNGSGGISVENGRLFTRGECTGDITVAAPGTKNCDLGSGPNPPMSQDPDYEPAVKTSPPAPGLTACDPVSGVLTLQPGSYDQALLDSALKSCAKVGVVVLAPGASDAPEASTYYFHDAKMPNGIVVAGTTNTPRLANPFGQRCDENARGVQIIFGENATLDQGPNDQFEACGFNAAQRGGNVDAPRIVLFGLKNNAGGMKRVCATPGCDVIIRTSGNEASLHLAGTVYMPTADLSLQVTNESIEAVSDSLIAYSVELSASSSVITAPAIGTGAGLHKDGDVVFDASIDGTPWISSRVAYPNGSAPAEIKSWVIKR